MEKIKFTYAKINAKQHILKRDGDWYKVNLGGVNIFNQHNEFYLATGVKELLSENGSRLYQKLKNGYLEGECPHPVRTPNMNNMDFYIRNISIDPDRVSHAIREIELVDTGVPAGKGFSGNSLMFVGWVKPMGPKGAYLKERLDEPECNVAFSIRALTDIENRDGITIKTIKSIITFDFVDEPGIALANKWDTSTESFSSSKNIEVLDETSYFSYNIKDIESFEKRLKDESVDRQSYNNFLSIREELKSKHSTIDNLAILNW